MPLDPIAYKPYADPDDFIREVTDFIWVNRGHRLHPGELRARLDRAHRVRHHPRRDEVIAGTLMRISDTPRPHRPGRGRGLGGPRRRRVPELAPGPVGGPDTPTAQRTIANCLYRRGRMVEEWVVRDNLAIALQPGSIPTSWPGRKSFRGYPAA